MNFFQIERPISPVSSEVVFSIFDYPISNTTLLILFIALLLLAVSLLFIKKFKINPNSKKQTAVELLYELVFNLINQVTGNKNLTLQLFPIAGAVFFYILISNLIGTFLPGLTSITYEGVVMFRTPTSDFNTTFGLALGAIILTHVASIRDWGFFGHMGKFLQFKEIYHGFKKSTGEGFMAIVGFFVGLLDIVGEFAKIVALSLRLFGNLYAGEVLLMVIFGGLAYFLPVLWMTLSTFSGIVQAVVFCLLFTAYYSLSVKPVED